MLLSQQEKQANRQVGYILCITQPSLPEKNNFQRDSHVVGCTELYTKKAHTQFQSVILETMCES